jgi:hypothetical protein
LLGDGEVAAAHLRLSHSRGGTKAGLALFLLAKVIEELGQLDP